MATIPSPPTKAVGDLVLAADWNDYVKGVRDFLIVDKPVFHARQAVAQSGWTSATYTAVTFTTEELDRDGMHSTTVNTSRITIGGTLGWWRLTGTTTITGNTNTTLARSGFFLNGSIIGGSVSSMSPASTSNALALSCTALVEATLSGDYVELVGWVTASAGTLGTNVTGTFQSHVVAEFIGT